MGITQKSKRSKLTDELPTIEFPIDILVHYLVPYIFEYSAAEIPNLKAKPHLILKKKTQQKLQLFLGITRYNRELYKLRYQCLPEFSVAFTKFAYGVCNRLMSL
jgi:hypothetical protein